MGDKIIHVAICAPIKENKVLLIKRVKEPYAGFWGLPGGKVDFGEHPKETAVREVEEETGIRCEFNSFKGVASEIIKEDDKIAHHFLFYLCTLNPINTDHHDGKPDEIHEVMWADINSLPEENFVPSDLVFLKNILLKDHKINIHDVRITKKGSEYKIEDFEI